MGDRLDKHKALDSFKISRRGTDFAYRTVAERFKMIESGLAPVIINADKKSSRAINNLGIAAISSERIARKLHQYIVQVSPQARDILIWENADYLAAENSVI